jgi:hypothetical protein
MITREQAQDIARTVIGAEPEDEARGWELVEFDAGWLIREKAASGGRGAATRVIERDTGRVMRFPSGVPPVRIRNDYQSVMPDGHVESFD